MINDKDKANKEIFERDRAGRFVKIGVAEDIKEKMHRPLTDKEKQMIEEFERKQNGSSN